MHVHSEGLGLEEPTVIPGLMNDHLTGYLLAIAVVAALAGRGRKRRFLASRRVAYSYFHVRQ